MKIITQYSPCFDTEEGQQTCFNYLMAHLSQDVPRNFDLPVDIHIEIEQGEFDSRFIAVIQGREIRAARMVLL